MLKEKGETKRDLSKTKMKLFLVDFCGFKAKREEIKNNNFKNNGKTKRIFPTQMFFKPRDQKRKREFVQRFSKKATTFHNLWIPKNGVKKRNRVRKKNQKMEE